MQKKTTIFAVATGLLLAPLATAGNHDKNDNQTRTTQTSHNERRNLFVNVGGTHMSIDDLEGTNVVNHKGENLGEIEDVIYGSNGEKATHVIVSTDNWFDGRSALVPIKSLEQANESTRDGIIENLRGGVVVLVMPEKRFDSIATFERGADLEEYLDQKASDIAKAFGLKETDIFDKSQNYHAAITNRSKEKRDEDHQISINAQDSKAWKNQDTQKYRYSSDSAPLKDIEIKIDNKSTKASDLKGIEVVNYDDERLGKVVDIIVDDKGQKAHYIVVRTDDWFDGEYAIIPLMSVKYHADTKDGHPNDGANWWMGDHIVLNMSEDKFEELADYRRDQDPNTYIKDNRDRMSDTYSINRSGLRLNGAHYSFMYSIPDAAAMHDSNQQRRSVGNNGADQMKNRNIPSKNQVVNLGDSSIKARELKGKKVKAKDGEKVATVSDIIADANSGKLEFLVLESSKNHEKTIVPISSIESSAEESDHDHKGLTCATWDGKGLTLSSEASEYRSWATFKSTEDFEAFLDTNAGSFSQAFGIDEREFSDSDKDYVFMFESAGYSTASL